MFGNWGRRKRGFAEEMIASFPEGLSPPEPLVRFFRWQEANRLDRAENGERYALIDPNQTDACMYVQPVDPRYVETWLEGADPEEQAWLAPFARTGGDGSVAALWRDDSGRQRIVHMGSGSGSTMLCVLADDPVDFLRLLAIGYDELCWPENFSETPEDVHGMQFDEPGDPPYQRRTQLKAWVEREFGVRVPDTAAEIVRRTADMDAEQSDDPFWNWMRSMQGWRDRA